MADIIISADSTVDMTGEQLAAFGVKTVPLHVSFDSREFSDGIDFTAADVFAHYDSDKILPKTSAVSIEEYRTFFASLTENGDAVVHFSLSSGVSSSHNNALIAARDFENIFVVDTLTLSSAMGLLVIKACEMRDSGLSAKEIFTRSNLLREKVRCSFIVDKLDFLHKGGRCSALTLFGSNLLSIKPSIEMHEGKLGVAKKYRGKTAVCQAQYIRDALADSENIDTSVAFITTTVDVSEQQLSEYKKEVTAKVRFDRLLTSTAGCTITSHCGHNAMGVLFLVK